jgi:hypothetical protein
MLALSSTAGVIGSGLAWLIGWLAALAGLPAAMWLLLLGPTGLIVFLPRGEGRRAGRGDPPEAESVPISP